MNQIPRILWQTAFSTASLPPESVGLRQTWRSMNPELELRLCDNSEFRELFVDHLPRFLDLFDGLPLGVMKADLWRYAVVFVHGGIYADIDTACQQPLSEWMDPRGNGLTVACENGSPYFCQWAFSAPAGHQALLNALELAAERFEADQGVDLGRDEFVHYYTGPQLWTEAIHAYLGTSGGASEIERDKASWQEMDIMIHPPGYFTWGAIRHEFASYHWHQPGYTSWRHEVRELTDAQMRPRCDLLKSLLKPLEVETLRRYGDQGDGGYILFEPSLAASEAVYSYGHDEKFNDSINDAGLKIIAWGDLNRGMEPCAQILEDIRDSGHWDSSSLTLKMDVEGMEYDALGPNFDEISARFSQIVIEFHHLMRGPESCGNGLSRIEIVERMLERYYLAHLHGNNYGTTINEVPEVLECLFLRKDQLAAKPEVSSRGCPRPDLDFANHPGREDLRLDWWLPRPLTKDPTIRGEGSKVGLVTLHTPDIKEWCERHANDKLDYCSKWNLTFYLYEETLEPGRWISWSKIIAVRNHLKDHEWIFWTDADTTISNTTIDVRSLCDEEFDLIVTEDQNGFNSGIFLLRNTSVAFDFLESVWGRNINECHFEQTAMAQIMGEMTDLRVKRLPKRTMNSYWNDYRAGDFIFHAPGEPNETKKKILEVVANSNRGPAA